MADADLRPMTLGEVLDRTFSLYREHFGVFLGIMSLPMVALVAFIVLAVVVGAGLGIGIVAGGRAQTLGPSAAASIMAGTFAGVVIFLIGFFVVYAAAEIASVSAASELYLGKAVTIRGSLGKIRGRLLRLIGAMLIIGLLAMMAFFAAFIISFILPFPRFSVILVGFIAAMIPAFIILTRTALALPIVALERESPVAAIRRSIELTKGFSWSMFAIFLLYWVLSAIAAVIFQYPLMFLALATRNNQAASAILLVLQNVSSLFASALVGPIYPIAFCLMYYNLRVRKEGFDLQHLMASLSSEPPPPMETPAAPTAV